jgi:hypothetical protein
VSTVCDLGAAGRTVNPASWQTMLDELMGRVGARDTAKS